MINIYLCGPTVYDYQHLGNIRPVIIMDFFIKSSNYLNQKVYYVHNITDIDDKIIQKSIKLNISEEKIAQKYTKEYLSILKSLDITMPNKMPRVSENIEQIITFIKILIKNKSAYIINGSVYFDINSTKGYGNISNLKFNDDFTIENTDKKNPQDFALWKNTNIGITWNSPWSKGRPGWHTECSTFINDIFDSKTIDIHAGGIDLKFPHNENENIQYIAANKRDLARTWHHFGHLMLNKDKMSKSLGNIIRADKFIKEYNPNILRWLFVLTNPKMPMSITEKLIHNAKKLDKKLERIWHKNHDTYIKNNTKNEFANFIINFKFSDAMLFLHKTLKRYDESNKDDAHTIINIINLLGLSYKNKVISDENKELLKKWEFYKSKKDYQAADKIRKKLIKMNII